MNRIICIAFVVVISALSQNVAADRGRVRIQNNTVVTDKGELIRGRPMDFKDSWPAYTMKESNWKKARDDGFNAVRLILRRDVSNGKEMYTTEQLDKVVDYAGRNDLYLIIDLHLHRKSDFYGPNETRTFWKKYAPRYKDRTHVLYEGLNEPEYSGAVIPQDELYQIIRSGAPNAHIILFSFAHGISESKIQAVKGVDWKNASVGWHAYGAGPAGVMTILKSIGKAGIMTEAFLSRNLVVNHEAAKMAWIPWGRTSSGPTNEPPWHFDEEWPKIVVELKKLGIWWADSKTELAFLTHRPMQVTRAPATPTLGLELGALRWSIAGHDAQGRRLIGFSTVSRGETWVHRSDYK